jgi:hypothetical protein
MKTTTIGLRLNDYQLEKLNKIAERNGLHRMDLLRLLLESVIDGKVTVEHGSVKVPEVEEEVDLSAFEKLAEKKRISVQGLLDLIAEQLGA